MNEEDHIILAIDLNRHVLTSKEAEELTSIGLIEAITKKHKSTWGLAPTRNRSQVPIDGIHISASLTIIQEGYLPFAQAPSDHRAL